MPFFNARFTVVSILGEAHFRCRVFYLFAPDYALFWSPLVSFFQSLFCALFWYRLRHVFGPGLCPFSAPDCVMFRSTIPYAPVLDLSIFRFTILSLFDAIYVMFDARLLVVSEPDLYHFSSLDCISFCPPITSLFRCPIYIIFWCPVYLSFFGTRLRIFRCPIVYFLVPDSAVFRCSILPFFRTR